jgi:Flp pilus assembly pilin Flp
MDLEAGLEAAWANVATFVPRLVVFGIILALGYAIAKAIGKVVDKVLERVGFDRAVERGGIKQAMARSKYDASDIVSKLVFYTLFLFVLQLAFGVFGPNPVSDLITGVIAFLPKVFVAIVIVVIASAIAKGVNDILGNALGGLSYGPVVAKVASGFILFFGVVAALNQIEVAQFVTQALTTAVLVALVGTVIVGVGGGLVKPMQSRWERILDRASDETQNARQQVQANRQGADPYPAYDDAPVGTTGPTAGTRASGATTAVYRPSGSTRQ